MIHPRRVLPRLIAMTFTCLSVVVASLLLPSSAAQAAVFSNSGRWPTVSGVTKIPVCIVSGSDANQKANGLIHDRNPSLSDVVGHVRSAVSNAWESGTSIQFTGWGNCDQLSANDRTQAVGLYIHRDAPNNSKVGAAARGHTSPGDVGTQFKPWGNDHQCINYNWRTTHMEYRFDCVEQYAVHEFGHMIGFQHEWRSPSRPAGCNGSEPALTPADSYATSWPNSAKYTVLENGYDWDSVMTYDDSCAHVTGERFGSPSVDDQDRAAVRAIYPGELVVNGGFDQPDVPTGGWSLFRSIPGWTEASGGYLEIQDPSSSPLGPMVGQYAEVDSNTSSKLSQRVNTMAGRQYRICLWAKSRPGTAAQDNNAAVVWNGTPVLSISNPAGLPGLDGWQPLCVTSSAATSTSTELRIDDLGPSNGLGLFVDNVSVRLDS